MKFLLLIIAVSLLTMTCKKEEAPVPVVCYECITTTYEEILLYDSSNPIIPIGRPISVTPGNPVILCNVNSVWDRDKYIKSKYLYRPGSFSVGKLYTETKCNVKR